MVEPISEIVDYMPKRTSPLTSATPQDHRDKKGENAPSSQEARSFQKLGSQEFEELSRSLDKRKLSYRFFKRVFDISFSILVLIICVLLLPITACLLVVIAVQTKASPIYVQERVGRYGHPMRIYKLRSMVGDSDNVEKYLSDNQLDQWRKERKVSDDVRVVPIGRFIRKMSIDEFANVLNVLAGQMSVIGPRPISYEEMQWFTPEEQAKLLSLPGGITGLWQATSRNDATFESGERQAIELEYVETASFKMDWRVFKMTFRAMLQGTGR